MKHPYEYDATTDTVFICAYCENKREMDERAIREHPQSNHSHGICHLCLDKEIAKIQEPAIVHRDVLEGRVS